MYNAFAKHNTACVTTKCKARIFIAFISSPYLTRYIGLSASLGACRATKGFPEDTDHGSKSDYSERLFVKDKRKVDSEKKNKNKKKEMKKGKNKGRKNERPRKGEREII